MSQTTQILTVPPYVNSAMKFVLHSPLHRMVRGRELQGLAEPIAEDKSAIAAGLAEHLCKVPSDARYYGVTFDEGGNPRTEDVELAAQSVVMLHIRLC